VKKEVPEVSTMTASKLWRTAAASLSFIAASALAAADEPYLVRDIHPGAGPALGSQPVLIQTEDGPAFLVASDEDHGRELWITDGTAAGTRLVRDVCPGRCSSEPRHVGFLGGRLLFSARSAPNDPSHLWISDGTWEGTRALGSGAIFASSPVGTLEDRGLLFFAAVHGGEEGLWVTDGTPGGTRPLALDGPDGWPFSPHGGTVGSGRLAFGARSADGGEETWATDGTDAGTRRLAAIPLGRHPTFSNTLVRVGARTLVFVRSPAPGCAIELWSTAGTPAGTARLLDFELSPCTGPFADPLAGETGGSAWFVGREGGDPPQLWRSDGTPAGTRAVTSFTGDAFADQVLAVGDGEALFSADDGVHGREPWIASLAGARLLADVCSGFCDSAPAGLGFPGDFYFSADDGFHGFEPWRREGGAAVLVEDVCPGSCSSSPAQLAAAGGRVFFIASAPSGEPGRELWTTPLGGNGATRLTDFTSIIPFPFNFSFTYSAAAVGGLVLFTADDGEHGIEVWRSDGTPAGTALVADLETRGEPGEGSDLVFPTAWGDRLLFFAREPDLGYQPWVSDGTEPGTQRLGVVTWPDPENPFEVLYSQPVVLSPDALFVAAEVPFAPLELWRAPVAGAPVRVLELGAGGPPGAVVAERLDGRAVFLAPSGGIGPGGAWATDGTPAGTRRLGELLIPYHRSDTGRTGELGGRLFFAAADDPQASDDFELWATDGTPGGTARVAEISPGPNAGYPEAFARLGGRLLFAAHRDGEGRELWETDGTAAGTRLLAELVEGSRGSEPLGLTAVGARVFFFAGDDPVSRELWTTDGTAAGTVRLAVVPPVVLFGSGPPWRAAAGGRFYFVTGGERHDLWVSDGTVAGTGILRPLLPATTQINGVWSAGDRVRVSMSVVDPFDLVQELWETDGTLAGTRKLISLVTTGFSSRISDLVQIGSLLFFQGPHPEAGPELMALPVGPPVPCAAGAQTLCLRGGRFAVRARWRDPRSGDQGNAGALPMPGSDRTGLFWFFSPDNVELVFKTLDGGPVNGFFWNFYGALSDVEYTIEVTDTATGRRTEYFNPGGEICGRGDTTAFPARPPVPLPVPPPFFAPVRSAAAAGAGGTACGGDPGDLCLLGDRFRVEVEWADQRSGDSGVGTALPFADRSGFFWFFEPQNVELVVKILDGTEVNGRFWVFYGGLSDVAYTITVTDTETGEQAVYHNSPGEICGRGDTTAF
jgi:ELWxxDGT repeat protein